MTPDLYWYLITESIRYYVNQLGLLVAYYIPYAPAILLSFVTVCAGYAYIVNLRRPSDDPLKRKYYLSGILLAPLISILSFSLLIFVFIIEALFFAIFLVFYAVLMAARRRPFILIWLHTLAMKIGEPLLKINARLLRIAMGR